MLRRKYVDIEQNKEINSLKKELDKSKIIENSLIKIYKNVSTDNSIIELSISNTILTRELNEGEALFFINEKINDDILKIKIGNNIYTVYKDDTEVKPGTVTSGIYILSKINNKYIIHDIKSDFNLIISIGNRLLITLKSILNSIKEKLHDNFRING